MEHLMFFVLMSVTCCNLSPERMIWTKERNNYWWENIVKSAFTAQDWLENFWMSQRTFLYLCDKLWSSMEKSDIDMRKAVPIDKHVALALWFLATGADYRTIGHLFSVSKSTVCLVLKYMCSAVVNHLLPQYIRLPIC